MLNYAKILADETDGGTPLGKHRTYRHPVVDGFLHTHQRLGEIISAIPEPRDAVTNAIMALRDATVKQRPAEEARALAEGLDTSGADPDLLAIFYSTWGRLSMAYGRLAEAVALYKQAWALVDEHTPPEIRALLTVLDGMLCGLTGRGEEGEARYAETMAMLSKRSPRYVAFLGERAMQLAIAGRGAEAVAEFVRRVEGREDLRASWARHLDLLLLYHYGETGRLEEVAARVAALRANPTLRMHTDPMSYYGTIVSVLSGKDEGEVPDWAATLRELLADRPDRALA
jgi:hypothetical protein